MSRNVTSHHQSGGITAHKVNLGDHEPPQPKRWLGWFWIAVAVVGGIAAIVTILVFFDVNPWSKDMPENGDDPTINVTSHGQQGGITAGIVNISAEPQARISLSERTHKETETGHLYEALLTVDTRYLIPSLRLEAHAHSIQSLNVVPQVGGLFMTGHTGKREGFHFSTLQNVAGQYRVRVITSEPEEVRIDLE